MGRAGDGKHKDLTFRIIGRAHHVHASLGPGFPESIYHNALCRGLMMAEICFESQKTYEVYYEGYRCGEFRPDLVVQDCVIVELKALSSLTEDHAAQLLSYLKASELEVGLLLNFGRKALEVKRFVL